MNEQWSSLIIALIVTILGGLALLFIEYRTRWFARFTATIDKNKSESPQAMQHHKVVTKIGGDVASNSTLYVAGGDIGAHELSESSGYEKISSDVQLTIDGNVGQDSDIKVAGENIDTGTS